MKECSFHSSEAEGGLVARYVLTELVVDVHLKIKTKQIRKNNKFFSLAANKKTNVMKSLKNFFADDKNVTQTFENNTEELKNAM